MQNASIDMRLKKIKAPVCNHFSWTWCKFLKLDLLVHDKASHCQFKEVRWVMLFCHCLHKDSCPSVTILLIYSDQRAGLLCVKTCTPANSVTSLDIHVWGTTNYQTEKLYHVCNVVWLTTIKISLSFYHYGNSGES